MNNTVFRIGTTVVLAGVVAMAVPIILVVTGNDLWLITLGVIGVIGLGLIQVMPYFNQKFENIILYLYDSTRRTNTLDIGQQCIHPAVAEVKIDVIPSPCVRSRVVDRTLWGHRKNQSLRTSARQPDKVRHIPRQKRP